MAPPRRKTSLFHVLWRTMFPHFHAVNPGTEPFCQCEVHGDAWGKLDLLAICRVPSTLLNNK